MGSKGRIRFDSEERESAKSLVSFPRLHAAYTTHKGENGTHQAERKWTRRNNFLTPSPAPIRPLHPPPSAFPSSRPLGRYWNFDQFAKSIHVEMNLHVISPGRFSPSRSFTLRPAYPTYTHYPLEQASRPSPSPVHPNIRDTSTRPTSTFFLSLCLFASLEREEESVRDLRA